MIKAIVADSKGGPLHSGKLVIQSLFRGMRNHLIIGSAPFAHGVWNSEVIAGVATTPIVACPPGGSLIVTDIVISAKKVVGSTLILCFDDGDDSKIIAAPDTAQQSTNFSWAPTGRVQGWQDAAITAITTHANFDGTVFVGYIVVASGLTYSKWQKRQ